MSNYEKKTGHPVLGIILGIIGIMAAALLSVLTGVIGGAVAGVLGLAALLLGIFAVKGGRRGGGAAAVVAGVLAIILAVTMTYGTVGMLNEMKEKAKSNPNTPLMAKYLDNPSMGFLGIVLAISKDGEAEKTDTETLLKALNKEMDLLKETTGAPAATAAPAQ